MSTYILAIDTTTEACSAALMIDEYNIFENFNVADQKHTQLILPMIDKLLKEADVALKDLDAIAFSCGPGSFTGIRISVGIAQGLAFGANLPLIGVSTLAALAEGVWRQTSVSQVLTAIDARVGAVYWAQYQRETSGTWIGKDSEIMITPEALTVQALDLRGCWAIAGTGWQTYPSLINDERVKLISGNTLLPSARDILPIAFRCYQNGDAKSVEYAEPAYLHNEAIWKKLPGRKRN